MAPHKAAKNAAKKVAKKAAKKAAKHTPEHQAEKRQRDMRRAYEHLGRVQMLAPLLAAEPRRRSAHSRILRSPSSVQAPNEMLQTCCAQQSTFVSDRWRQLFQPTPLSP